MTRGAAVRSLCDLWNDASVPPSPLFPAVWGSRPRTPGEAELAWPWPPEQGTYDKARQHAGRPWPERHAVPSLETAW